jgi:hypothetical protein
MASTTHKRRMAPRPATDPQRWSRVTGGRNIRRQPKQSNLQKAMGALPIGKKAAPSKGSRKGTAGKAAMLTAAAGVAYKMFNKRRASGGGQPSV